LTGECFLQNGLAEADGALEAEQQKHGGVSLQ